MPLVTCYLPFCVILITMPKAEIITVPDKRLRQNSQRVGYFDESINAIIENMKAATLAWEATRDNEVGVALAAVQIGVMERIVIVRSHPDDKDSNEFQVFINPKITKREGKVVSQPEGCLSIPDIYAQVPRHETVRISAEDENGRPQRLKAHGFLARVFQHEIDHLHGKLFVDHVEEDKFYQIKEDGKLETLEQNSIETARVLWNC